jgi:maleylacetoacetate isomerase
MSSGNGWVLYSYWRSSAAYRVRIGLHLKGISFKTVPVHLVRNGGEQRTAEYRRLNPQGLVPALVTPEGEVLTQSLAILEYLDAVEPEPGLLPADPVQAAKVRALALSIACDIHPLDNLRVLQYLKGHLGCGPDDVNTWYRHWICEGFAAIEEQLSKTAGTCCFGDHPTMADACLVPQVYNAHRFGVDMGAYPTISRINEHCLQHPAFRAATPEAQPDAVPEHSTN